MANSNGDSGASSSRFTSSSSPDIFSTILHLYFSPLEGSVSFVRS